MGEAKVCYCLHSLCCHGYHRGPLPLLCPPSLPTPAPPPPNAHTQPSLIPPVSLLSPLTPSLSPTTFPTSSFLPPSTSSSPIHLFNTHLQWSWWVKLALHWNQKMRSHASCHGDEGKSPRQYWDQTSRLTFFVAKKVIAGLRDVDHTSTCYTHTSQTRCHTSTGHISISRTCCHTSTPTTGTCIYEKYSARHHCRSLEAGSYLK